MSHAVLRFGTFQLDPHDRRLVRDGDVVDLNARYLDALILLVEARGALVTKERFMDEVWRGIPVTDEALTQAVRTLRRALGDSATTSRFIQTIPKHGYRFIAPVVTVPMPTAKHATAKGFSRRRLVRWTLAGSGGAAIAGAAIGLLYGFVGVAHPHVGNAGGGGALSLLLVLMLVSTVSAGVSGAGIAAGIAWSSFIHPQRGRWTVAGGALGGLFTGAFANMIGGDAFRLLFGHAVKIAGAIEGLVLGGAIGLAMLLRRRWPTYNWALAGAIGAIAGLGIALLDGRMMAGSLQSLVAAFPFSQFGFDGVGKVLGETGLGPIGRAVTAALEGAVFSVGLVWGLQTAADDTNRSTALT
ncbi:winged helix-turn-helix domain-containing protein [Sphingomonas sp. PB4P5]|uniref:winged helix-turn-helix domain-containing protein n=1 Tax=Parasphingomonas puruogangriensis TaxID=3096155 RepID=UPI002FCB5800